MSAEIARNPRRILVIAVPGFGDVLLCTPLLSALRRAFPDAFIDVLLRPGRAAVLEGNPDVNGTIEIIKNRPLGETLSHARRLFRKYDLVLSNGISPRAAIYALLAGRERLSVLMPARQEKWLQRWRRWVYHAGTELDPQRHTLVQNSRLGELIGLSAGTRITPPRAAHGAARLDSLIGQDWRTRPFAVVHATSSGAYKRWEVEGWHQTIAHLRARGLEVILTGGGDAVERSYVDGLSAAFPGTTNLAGELRLGELTVLLEHCTIFVGVDTLVTHMAAAIGRPTVALFGPTNPLTWGPWPRGIIAEPGPFRAVGSQRVGNVFLVQGWAPCVPCAREGCLRHRDSHSECLRGLDAAEVNAAIDSSLDGTLRVGGEAPVAAQLHRAGRA